MDFLARKTALEAEHHELVSRKNEKILPGNGIYTRYRHPVVTAAHTPLFWRYDFREASNPFFNGTAGD